MKNLIKFAPTSITLAVVGWLLWPYLPGGAPEPPAASKKAAQGPSGRPASKPRAGSVVDPFRLLAALAKSADAPGAAPGKKEAAEPNKVDRENEAVRAMVLGATVVGGRKRIAMIDGRFYEPGDAILGPDGEPTPFRLHAVEPRWVELAAGARKIPLGYAATLASAASPEAAARPAPAGGDPDVRRAIAENTGPETEMLKSLLSSPIARTLLGLSGVGDVKTPPQQPSPASNARPGRNP